MESLLKVWTGLSSLENEPDFEWFLETFKKFLPPAGKDRAPILYCLTAVQEQ
jgi:hypothetical protein